MPPTVKDSDVIAPAPPTAAALPPAAEDSRQQPVALEVPVTVNGARTVDGSDKREPFSESTKTVLIFGNGAVIRLSSGVAAGQLLFLTNDKTKKEVVCQVVKSKNYRNVSGYVELEFTEPVVGFWGMRFPTDRVAPAPIAPAPVQRATIAPVAPKAESPSANAPAKTVEFKPPVATLAPPAPKVADPSAPTAKPSVKEIPAAPSVAAATQTPVIAPLPKLEATKPEPQKTQPAPTPVSTAPRVEEIKPVAAAPQSSAPAPSPVSPVAAVASSTQTSSETLKLEAARLREQLSSPLVADASVAPPKPLVPAQNNPPSSEPKNSTAADTAAKVLDIAHSEPRSLAPVVPPATTKTPVPPVKSAFEAEEVQIPSWLEPLARNAAAAPPAQPAAPAEETVHTDAAHQVEEVQAPMIPAADEAQSASSPEFGSSFLGESVAAAEKSSGGGSKGLIFGIAAGILVLAGGGYWYFTQSSNGAPRTTAQVTSPAPTSSSATSRSIPVPQNAPAAQPQPPAFSSISSAPVAASASPAAVPANTPAVSSAKPAASNTSGAATRSSQPVEPEPKKQTLGTVRLSAPSVSRKARNSDGGDAAPSLGEASSDDSSATLGAGLAGEAKQPVAPHVPLPVGGDVKPARMISSVQPAYPMLAKNQHISGDVRVDALIDANGRVSAMKVISGPALLHQAAMDALHQWKYQPATLDGKAVPMHLTVTIQFRLQ